MATDAVCIPTHLADHKALSDKPLSRFEAVVVHIESKTGPERYNSMHHMNHQQPPDLLGRFGSMSPSAPYADVVSEISSENAQNRLKHTDYTKLRAPPPLLALPRGVHF
jgi:hypothetical protein